MIYKFSEILTIKNGKNQKKIENPLGKYPIYGSGGIIGYGNDYICEKDTVVIGRKGNINKPLYIEEPFWNVDTAFGLVADINILFPKYLYYFCVKYNFEKLNTTVTIPSLTKSNLLEIKIDLPNLFNQKEISKKLDKILKILELKKQQNSELDRLVKFQFLKMFGDPILNEKNWEIKDLQKLSILKSGGTPSRNNPNYFKGNIPWITTVSLGKLKISEEDAVEFITHEAIENSATKLIPVMSLLFGVRVGVGKSSINLIPLCINQDIIAITGIKSIINIIFLKNLLDLHFNYFNTQKRGATIQGIKSDILKKLSIICPPIELQNKFAEFVKQVDKSKVIFEKTLKILDFGLNYFNVL